MRKQAIGGAIASNGSAMAVPVAIIVAVTENEKN